MLNLLKDMVKFGAACITTYAIYKVAEEIKSSNKEEIKKETTIEKIEGPKEIVVEEDKEIIDVKVEDKKESIVKRLLKNKLKNNSIVINTVNNANDVLENANDAVDNANEVLANANKAIANINNTISKINKDIENIKKYGFIFAVFAIVYYLIK